MKKRTRTTRTGRAKRATRATRATRRSAAAKQTAKQAPPAEPELPAVDTDILIFLEGEFFHPCPTMAANIWRAKRRLDDEQREQREAATATA